MYSTENCIQYSMKNHDGKTLYIYKLNHFLVQQ